MWRRTMCPPGAALRHGQVGAGQQTGRQRADDRRRTQLHAWTLVARGHVQLKGVIDPMQADHAMAKPDAA